MKCWRLSLLALGLVVAAGCFPPPADGVGANDDATSAPAATDRPRIGFVTNQIAAFWSIAEAGCQDAAKELDVDVEVRMPSEATAERQKRVVEDMMINGLDALAISPIDADNQTELLNTWAEKIPLITHDSDAPESNRLMYIGMDNYLAGRMCGELVKEALPEGGEVLLTIGRLVQDNSKRRRQGVIDVLIGRDAFQSFDPNGSPIEGNGYIIVDTLTDGGDETVAKRKAEDALTRYPNLKAMVGLFEYNPPALIQAAKTHGKLRSADNPKGVFIIGFDENDLTLQGVIDQSVVGTVVQDPYLYGFQSVMCLKSLIDGDDSVIPKGKFIDIPAKTITSENVVEFWDDKKAKTGG